VIFCDRSPLATAVGDLGDVGTWSVRFVAKKLTRVCEVPSMCPPRAPGTSAWAPSTPSVPTSRATPVTWSSNVRSVSVIELIVTASAANIRPWPLTVTFCDRSAVGDRGGDVDDLAHLVGKFVRHVVDVGAARGLPGAARPPAHLGLAAEDALRAHLAATRVTSSRTTTADRPSR
jgi:hypothetical protein